MRDMMRWFACLIQAAAFSALTSSPATAAITIFPDPIAFGSVDINAGQLGRNIELSIVGAPTSITSISITGPDGSEFTRNFWCDPSGPKPPGSICSFDIFFDPSMTGARSATLEVGFDDGSPGTATVNITALGVIAGGSLAPSPPLNFGNTTVGQTSAIQTLTLTADSGPVAGNLIVSSVALGGTNTGDFTLGQDCTPMAIAPGNHCTISVSFSPIATGARAATITVASNADTPIPVANLSGTGVVPEILVSPTIMAFGTQPLGQPTATQTVTVTNQGLGTLLVSIVSNAPTEFQLSSNTCSTVAPAQSCTAQVAFVPFATGARSSSLTINSNDSDEPTTTVTLSGAGVAIDTTPNAFSFNDVTGVARNSTQTSNAVTIGGINVPANISVSGGEYSIGCTLTFVAGDSTIANGQSVCVRHMASSGNGQATNTTLTVGGVPDTFSSTTLPAFTLTAAADGTGSGTIAGTGVSCPGDCSESVDSGTQIMLTATPNAGSVFAGWSGAGCSGTGTCTATLDADKTATATFTALIVYNVVLEGWQQVAPYVITPASGGGTATFNPVSKQLALNLTYSGLSSTETMAHIHGPGARGANSGIVFPLANGSPKTDVVTLNPTQETQLQAGQLYVNIHTNTYGNGEIRGQIDNAGAIILRNLAVLRTGPGSGTVSGTTEAGVVVSCAPDCAETIPHGKSVTLTATPAAGSVFVGWAGDCSGNVACQLTMSVPRIAEAVFGLAPHTLAVTKQGTGSGTVTSSPAGIDCGATCSAPYSPATPVSLTAAPAPGSVFIGWSGDCTGTGGCLMMMDAARSVTATFDVANPPRLGNVSTRMQVLTGNDVMIGGFVIGGSTTKRVAIVATGPSLAAFGITNPLANPTLTLVRSSDQAVIASSDDWQTAANQADLTAAGFAPSNTLEAAILADLAPGAYTAIVQGAGGVTGVSVIGVYEVNHPETPLINISTRGRVLTGNDVMIGGFIINGTGSQTVAIVATGPSLSAFGIANPLANPNLTLVRSSDQAVIATNDDWQADANAAQLQAAGFAPSNTLESGIYITLQPGAYTAILSGVDGGTGVGVIGIYKVGP